MVPELLEVPTKLRPDGLRELPRGYRVGPATVHAFSSVEDAATQLDALIQASGEQVFVVAVNPEKIMRARRDQRLQAVLRSATFGICDGVGVTWALRSEYGVRVPRCTGIDLFFSLLSIAAERERRVFILGASPEVNAVACKALRDSEPRLNIVGAHHGYLPAGDHEILEEINSREPDYLFVAMGSPRQEFWIEENRKSLKPRLLMGIGGTLDVVAGRVPRAPQVFRNLGLEFLYRLIREPSRLRRQAALPAYASLLVGRSVRRLLGFKPPEDW